MALSEQAYQNKVIKALEERGYYVLKLITTNKNGIPDLLALKQCEVWFIEVKARGGRISPLQEYREKELKKKHFKHSFTFEGDDFLTNLSQS